MVMTSGTILDSVGRLADVPAGQMGDIVRLANGGFAVVASNELGFTTIRQFGANGAPTSSSVVLGTDASVTQLSNGQLVVSTMVNGDAKLSRVFANGVVREIGTIDGSGGVDFVETSVVALGGGTFAMVGNGDFGSDRDMEIVLFANNGNETGRIVVETGIARSSDTPSIARLANGNIIVAYTDTETGFLATSVRYAIYDPAGNEVMAPTLVPNNGGGDGEDRNPDVVAVGDGFAIVYESRVFNFTSIDIRAAVFNANGFQLRDVFITNANVGNTGTDDESDDRNPTIAVGPDGVIAVTYTENVEGNANQRVSLTLSGGQVTELVGNFPADGQQTAPMISFFGVGQIAAYHFDATLGAMVGFQFSGFRDSFGDDSADTFVGDDFVDLINGLGGKDTLSGGNNDDTVQGGDGEDKLFGGNGNDLLQGEEGNGTETAGRHRDTLFGGAGNDRLEGENDHDVLDGGTDDDFLFGGGGNDRLVGRTGNDNLSGDGGNDTLQGDAGQDTLTGGIGLDTLTGGADADVFVILTASAADTDTISDFVSGVDKILLDSQVFTALQGFVDPSEFRLNTRARDADDFLIYNAATGVLFYDDNANVAGGAIAIAKFGVGTTLLATDILL